MHSLGMLPHTLTKRLITLLIQQHMLDPRTLKLFVSSFLRKLTLENYNQATNDFLLAVRRHHNLKVLSLHSCPISDLGILFIANLKACIDSSEPGGLQANYRRELNSD